MAFILITVLKILSIVVPLLISVAYFTIAERKIMGAIQRLFTKETTLPTSANIGIFLFAPALAFILSLVGWSVIPFSEGVVVCDLNLGVLYLLAVSSLNVYGILLAGWSSNVRLKWILFGIYQ
jgi:NADH-quinone oxidoreductase subunit H